MDKVFFVLSNLLVLLNAIFISDIMFANRDLWRKALIVISSYPIIILLGILSLGVLDKLNIFACILFFGIFLLFLVFIKYRTKKIQSIGNIQLCKNILAQKKILYKICLFSCVTFIASIFIGCCLLKGTMFVYDDYTYHASVTAHWCLDEYLSLSPQNYHCYYPFNAEVLSLWFMLPVRSDAFVSLVGIYWAILSVFSAGIICKSFGMSKVGIGLSSVLLLASPVIKQAIRSFSAVDLASPAMVLAGIAMIIPARDQSTNKNKSIEFLYCGILTGFAIGCKISFVVFAFIPLFWILFSRSNAQNGKTKIQLMGCFFAGSLITGGFWYIRNFIITGNPVFPADFGCFSGPFLAEQINRTRMITWIINDPWHFDRWKYIIQQLVSWPPLLFLVSFIGYLEAVRMLWKKGLKTEQRSIIGLLLTTGLIMFLTHPLMPYSGTNDSPVANFRINLRFFILPYLVGWLLYCLLLESVTKKKLWLGFALAAAVLPLGINLMHNCLLNICIIFVVIAIVFIWNFWDTYFQFIMRARYICLILIVVFFSGFSLCYPYQKHFTDQNVFSYESDFYPVGQAWQFIDTFPDRSVIGWGGTPQYYPLFGRSFQFKPIAVSSTGEQILPLHKYWARDPENTVRWRQKEPDANFVDNLIESRVEYFLIARLPKEMWPLQMKFLENSDKTQKIYHNEVSVIWKILPVYYGEKKE